MNRRAFVSIGGSVAVAGVASLAGCSALGSSEEDDVVRMAVSNKWLKFEHVPVKDQTEGKGVGGIIDVRSNEASLHSIVVEETELTEADIGPETTLGDLPMPEIIAAFQNAEYGSITRTYVWVEGELQSKDEVNDIDPADDRYMQSVYLAPTEYFDFIDPGKTERFRVARPGHYYPERTQGRIIDIRPH